MKRKTLVSLSLITLIALVSLAAHAQTFSVIHTFTDTTGYDAYGGVTVRGSLLYGTTNTWPSTVYQLIPSGSDWLFSTILVLNNQGNGLVSRVVFGPDNHLYGTAQEGGPYNEGAVFKLTPPLGPCKTVACYWTENIIHQFGSGNDGSTPGEGDLIWDQQGNIYGTTIEGGTSNLGTVYEISPQGNSWTESVLYSFSGPDGQGPANRLVLDNNGNLFSTTDAGGANNYGTIFELSYVVGVGWTQQILYNFQNGDDGQRPIGGLVMDASGNLYGAASDGGSGGGGNIFELSPSGNTWNFQVLYSFNGTSSCGPRANLTLDAAGNIYGTTLCDGAFGNGNVFDLANAQNGWQYNSLHDFTGGSDGGWRVYSGVTIDANGTLYGTTLRGGNFEGSCAAGPGCGVVWMIKP